MVCDCDISCSYSRLKISNSATVTYENWTQCLVDVYNRAVEKNELPISTNKHLEMHVKSKSSFLQLKSKKCTKYIFRLFPLVEFFNVTS